MVYQMETSRGGLKLVDDLNYIYRIDRKYGEKTYWKCDYMECKARVHTKLEDDGFIELSDDVDLPQELVSYFETHYIGGERGRGERRRRVEPTFPIELWNVFE